MNGAERLLKVGGTRALDGSGTSVPYVSDGQGEPSLAIEEVPNRGEAWLDRGTVRLHQGRCREAVEDCEKALALLRPESPLRAGLVAQFEQARATNGVSRAMVGRTGDGYGASPEGGTYALLSMWL